MFRKDIDQIKKEEILLNKNRYNFDERELTEYINQGKTRKELLDIYKCSSNTLSLALKKYNLHTSNIKNLIGRQFGRLKVIGMSKERTSDGHIQWICQCSCKNETIKNFSSHSLISGRSKSCGCLKEELSTIHGKYDTRIYRIWHGMKERCDNPNRHEFNYYGGRGIKVCNEWEDSKNGFINFYNWAINNGYSDDLTIERINTNGNYDPNNCKWATMKEQANNQRNNIIIEDKDGFITRTQFCEKYNITPSSLMYRLEHGDKGERLVRPKKTNKELYKNHW